MIKPKERSLISVSEDQTCSGDNTLSSESEVPLFSKPTDSKCTISVNAEKKCKKKSKQKTKSANVNDEDLDTLILEMSKLDSICAYLKCTKNVKLIGFKCPYCSRRHCVQHHLPEVHGCGDAIKSSARVLGSTTSAHGTTESTRDRAVLKKKLQSRIVKLSQKHKPRK